MRSSSDGFSLIETVIAMGVGTIVMAGIATVIHLNTLSFNHVEKNAQITNLMEEVKIALGDKNRCTFNLKNTPLSKAAPEGSVVAQIKHFEVNGAPLNSVVVVGTDMQGLTAHEIRLQPIAQLSAQRIVANLVLRFRRKHVLGPEEIVRTLPVSTKVENGKLIECTTSSNSEELISERICEIANGGEGKLDEETGQCIRTARAQWFFGGAFGVSCPTGWKLPPDPTWWDNCDWDQPEGFVDTREEVSRKYQDGTVRSVGPPPVGLDLDVSHNSCKCTFADGVPSDGWQCGIKCEEW